MRAEGAGKSTLIDSVLKGISPDELPGLTKEKRTLDFDHISKLTIPKLHFDDFSLSTANELAQLLNSSRIQNALNDFFETGKLDEDAKFAIACAHQAIQAKPFADVVSWDPIKNTFNLQDPQIEAANAAKARLELPVLNLHMLTADQQKLRAQARTDLEAVTLELEERAQARATQEGKNVIRFEGTVHGNGAGVVNCADRFTTDNIKTLAEQGYKVLAVEKPIDFQKSDLVGNVTLDLSDVDEQLSADELNSLIQRGIPLISQMQEGAMDNWQEIEDEASNHGMKVEFVDAPTAEHTKSQISIIAGMGVISKMEEESSILLKLLELRDKNALAGHNIDEQITYYQESMEKSLAFMKRNKNNFADYIATRDEAMATNLARVSEQGKTVFVCGMLHSAFENGVFTTPSAAKVLLNQGHPCYSLSMEFDGMLSPRKLDYINKPVGRIAENVRRINELLPGSFDSEELSSEKIGEAFGMFPELINTFEKALETEYPLDSMTQVSFFDAADDTTMQLAHDIRGTDHSPKYDGIIVVPRAFVKERPAISSQDFDWKAILASKKAGG